MTQNTLYALCREEARKQLCDELNLSATIITIKYHDELAQLTAEIYGMKLLQMDGIRRVTFAMHRVDPPIISPQQLHDHLVEQFNKEENNG